MEHLVAFPGLGLEFTLNRVAFTVFGKEIYWYGIIICIGFILGALYLSRRTKDYGLTTDNLYDVVLLAVPAGIVCARLYYVIFEWERYKDNLLDIFKIWEGGIAIYGGIIGAMIALVAYGKVKRVSIPDMADLAALGLLIGQAVGRWGNFVNAEAFGSETMRPWRMMIDGSAGVHPTFFYESIWNAIGFVLLHFHSKKRRFAGEIFLMYVAWYGFGRMFIEGLRTDSLYIPGTPIRVSQVLAAVSCIVAICLIVRGYKNHKTYAVPTEIQIDNTQEETE